MEHYTYDKIINHEERISQVEQLLAQLIEELKGKTTEKK